MSIRTHLSSIYIPLLLIILSTSVVYYPGLSGGFIFDDISNITTNQLVAMKHLDWTELKRAALSMDGRPISRATFGLNYLADGYNPFGYKLFNLLLHILNGILVFFLSRKLASAVCHKDSHNHSEFPLTLFATLSALAWVLHPVNLTNVLYVVQRMNSLSALFTLAGILLYMHGRMNIDASFRYGAASMIAAVLLFTPLAFFSKENGLLLPGLLFVIELTIFNFKTQSAATSRFILAYYILLLVIPIILAVLYVFTHPGRFHEGYYTRYFTLEERLLTETRVIWMYVKMILLPNPADLGLFQDDIPLSTSLFKPWTTFLSTLSLVVSISVAIWMRKAQPMLAFGFLFFLAGHVMESSFIPLELIFEHRNYLPSIGLITIVFYYLMHPTGSLLITKSRFYLSIAVIVILATITFIRSTDWANNVSLIIAEVKNNPHSPRANYEMGKLHGQALEQGTNKVEQHYKLASRFFISATEARDNFTSGLFGLILASLDAHKEIDPKLIHILAQRLEFEPFEQVNILWLRSLSQCVEKNKCKAEQIGFEKLFKASLNNATLSRKSRGTLYMILSEYRLKVDRNIDESLRYSGMGLKMMPRNVQYHLHHAQLSILAGKKDLARKSLENARRYDQNLLYSGTIAKLNRAVNQVKSK